MALATRESSRSTRPTRPSSPAEPLSTTTPTLGELSLKSPEPPTGGSSGKAARDTTSRSRPPNPRLLPSSNTAVTFFPSERLPFQAYKISPESNFAEQCLQPPAQLRLSTPTSTG